MKAIHKLRFKKFGFLLIRFIVSVLPLGIFVAIFHENYFGDFYKGASCFGYIIIIFALVCFKDTLATFMKTNAQLKVCLAIFLLSWIMRYLAQEFFMLSLLGAVGGALALIPEYVVRDLDDEIKYRKQGDAMASSFADQQIAFTVKKKEHSDDSEK